MAKLLLIVPTTVEINLHGAERFYTDGMTCWALDGRGRPGIEIPLPAWAAPNCLEASRALLAPTDP